MPFAKNSQAQILNTLTMSRIASVPSCLIQKKQSSCLYLKRLVGQVTNRENECFSFWSMFFNIYVMLRILHQLLSLKITLSCIFQHYAIQFLAFRLSLFHFRFYILTRGYQLLLHACQYLYRYLLNSCGAMQQTEILMII